MSLAKRLSVVVPQASHRSCGTCKWIDTLTPDDLKAFDHWILAERSLVQLWQIAVSDSENPYPLSADAMRKCIRSHRRN